MHCLLPPGARGARGGGLLLPVKTASSDIVITTVNCFFFCLDNNDGKKSNEERPELTGNDAPTCITMAAIVVSIITIRKINIVLILNNEFHN